MRDGPIGVFDSGLGGLTVLRALIDLLPDERIVYFGDTGRFPYGPKPHDEVLKYTLEITDVLLERGVKALVVACNSAAAAALDALDERLDIPVIGVIEPGLRAAARRHPDRPGRGDRHRRHDRVRRVPAARRRAGRRRSSSRAPRARASSSSSRPATSTPTRCTCSPSACWRRCATADVDTLVLGCTHYPLLARTIGDVMGQGRRAGVERRRDRVRGPRAPEPRGHAGAEPAAGRDNTFSSRVDRSIRSGRSGRGSSVPRSSTIEAWQWS